jgi:hypothetical protein
MFGSVGLTLFLVGVVWGAKRFSLMREGVKTTGSVVEVSQSDSTETRGTRTYKTTSYYPVVKFEAADGKSYRFRGSTGSAAPEYEPGTKVDVVYRRENPADAQIVDFEQFWLGPLAVGLFGFLFLVSGIGGFFLVADSDKTFGPAFEEKMARADLYDGKRGIPLPATVREIKKLAGGKARYVLACRGGASGGAERDFSSAPLSFDPGSAVIGKPVTVYMDPDDPERYYVDVAPLFGGGTARGGF